jgi:hypothetical protein
MRSAYGTQSVRGGVTTQSVGTIRIDGDQTGLFPAEAGPTKKHRVQPVRPVTRSVRGCIPERSVGTIKIKGFTAKAGPTKRF